MHKSKKTTRRCFLKHGASVAVSALAAPWVTSCGIVSTGRNPGANDRIRIGFIGTGHRARLLMDQTPSPGDIVAICDVDLRKCALARKEKGRDWPTFQDYRKILDDKNIDAVIVPTTDHGRVLPCIHACQAGKDIYAEKPLTLTIGEGRELVKAVRRYDRVFQTGTQQRSMEMNRYACDLVRTGGLGRLLAVRGPNYPSSKRCESLPEEPTPGELDWDQWCGATALVPYNEKRHKGWMSWSDYSGGTMTNWGAHGLDQVQWALGMDGTGPVEVWPEGTSPNAPVSLRYSNGIVVKLDMEWDSAPKGGAVFIGEKGTIRVERNRFIADPPELAENPPEPQTAEIWEGPGWQAKYHIGNWLDCIRSRETPIADVEIGHRSVSVCHLANIARLLGRPLKWDPARELFVDDESANTHVDRPRRLGYEYPDLS